ncbi:myosin light chain kinase family member 4 isoform X5 [Silurus meridionalis]|nr:myosin light chain kinase family member 4 isoform X5 [Silurus meridionalis]
MSTTDSKHGKCGLPNAVNAPMPHTAFLNNYVPLGGEAARPAIGRMEKVETLRCYWELKHVPKEGLGQQKEKKKTNVCLEVLKSQKKEPPDVTGTDQDDVEKVQMLNQQNTSLSHGNNEVKDSVKGLVDYSQDEKEVQTKKKSGKERLQAEGVEEEIEKEKHIFIESRLNEKLETNIEEENQRIENGDCLSVPEVSALLLSTCEFNQDHDVSQERGRVENLEKDLEKSKVEETSEEVAQSEEEKQPGVGASEVEPEKPAEERKKEPMPGEYIIDNSPPPPAPFEHRVVTTKTKHIATHYTINREEVLGGGRFGMVHKCVENNSGLTLAAKIIKTRNQKEKEVVKSEIEVMNQLNHTSLIQLYSAYESRNDITLVMEYVEGGELFDRIIDENYNLTELDTVLLIRQITEGLQYMHKMYILHLDLKPENILCVSRETNKIKIIDFGLARRYKPREKLRVNFGTPEFLAPEVINYEFVSFPTDMWSLGVITYML